MIFTLYLYFLLYLIFLLYSYHAADLHHVLASLDDLQHGSSRDQVADIDIEFICRVLHDPGIQSMVKV